MDFSNTFDLLDKMTETADRIIARSDQILDITRQVRHATDGERYIPVVKLQNREDWKFTLIDVGNGAKRLAIF